MIVRATFRTSPGGDTVQVESTAKFLRQLGVSVDIKFNDNQIDYSLYDIIHFFNIIRPDDILPHIKKSRIPFCVSTIYVDYSEYEKISRKGISSLLLKFITDDQLEYIKVIGRFFKNGDQIKSFHYLRAGHRSSVRYVAKKAAILLPNSHSEFKRFIDKYGVEVPYHKVPNAIDNTVFNFDMVENPAFKNHVLCVGRIEGRKNQLNLIKALADTEIKVTIIGKPSPNHLSYYEDCKKLVERCQNIQIIEHISHSELSAIFKAAKVHVLPSWFETTGLSSLEAAVMGCNVVITDKGDTREYFGDMAFYCDPESVVSIRSAVFEAYSQPLKEELRSIILDQYTWQKAAEETLAAYNKILFKEAL